MKKIIRTICLFRKDVTQADIEKLNYLKNLFEENGFIVQTIRLCSPTQNLLVLDTITAGSDIYLNVGNMSLEEAQTNLADFYQAKNLSFNMELANENLEMRHTKVLFDIIEKAPAKTFNFSYTFNNAKSSPFFPSAVYERDGFSIGLQATDLSENTNSLKEWFDNLKTIWREIDGLAINHSDYLGIDSSIAPLFIGSSSLVNFVKRLRVSFTDSVLTDVYLKMTKFIKESNPRPIGLNGLMFPALEDFELAEEYEIGNFSLERNIFLSLHSGLGIDTYPIGVDESPENVLNVMKTVQGLSNKYVKPLSIRFVSDGKAKNGEKTNFDNQFLKDVVIRSLSQ
jgi:uncharacterized protein (UPF0210 family)